MKSHRTPITAGAPIAWKVFGITIGFLHHRTVRISPSAAELPPTETNSSPDFSMRATNSPVLHTAKVSPRDSRCSTPMHLMQESLNLSGDQAEELEPILAAQQKLLAAFRRETSLPRSQRMARLKEVLETNDAQLKSVLAPEQVEKWLKRGLHPAGPSATDQQSAVTGG
ncbi:MAG: hypothetical protein KJ070_26685 [Verrucomicrobia bacterium]|nr:hypothetical protein [Verrucomicrobiota bacterium]